MSIELVRYIGTAHRANAGGEVFEPGGEAKEIDSDIVEYLVSISGSEWKRIDPDDALELETFSIPSGDTETAPAPLSDEPFDSEQDPDG